jgi:hypothetical protein
LYSAMSETYNEIRKNSCENNHDATQFVVLKSCGKRHCRECLKEKLEATLICNCPKQVSDEDKRFILGKEVFIICPICGERIEENDKMNLGRAFVHRACLPRN